MIMTRSPLRISLGGGGTDLASYYSKYEGFLIAGAINKYVYVNVTKPFSKGITLKYAKIEFVRTIAEVQHPIIRESLSLIEMKNKLEAVIRVLQQIMNEQQHITTLAAGTLEAVKLMPGYDEAIQKLTEKAKENLEAKEKVSDDPKLEI
jgi:galactokinase/mevalonate kinase-like predicted kinase